LRQSSQPAASVPQVDREFVSSVGAVEAILLDVGG